MCDGDNCHQLLGLLMAVAVTVVVRATLRLPPPGALAEAGAREMQPAKAIPARQDGFC